VEIPQNKTIRQTRGNCGSFGAQYQREISALLM